MRWTVVAAFATACGSAPPPPPAPPVPPPAATIAWNGLTLPLNGPALTERDTTLELDGGAVEPRALEQQYVAALTGQGWIETDHSPARPGELPGFLDDALRSMPLDYLGVTLDKVPDRIELSVIRDDEGTSVVLLYAANCAG